MSNTIKIAVYGNPAVELEGIISAAATTPGFLMKRHTDGTFKPHDVAITTASPIFAVEDTMTGGASATGSFVAAVDVPYATGDKAYFIYARPGDVMWAWLASGENVTAGVYLVSDGAGLLEAQTAPVAVDGAIVGMSIEAVNATAANTRIKVEIL